MATVETEKVKERLECAKKFRRERNAIHICLKYSGTNEA
jgi:hypothetical protein